MVKGSHNSFTYLKPRWWWMYLGRWIYRCQKKGYAAQIKTGAQVFDIRLRFDSDGSARICHGIFESARKFSTADLIKFLVEPLRANRKHSDYWFRMILETSKPDAFQEECFCEFCRTLEKTVPTWIQCIGGNRKFDWKYAYQFSTDPILVQLISSMASDARRYEKIWPWGYARRMNKENQKKHEDYSGIIMWDFI